MIQYALKCSQGHRFDSWFQSADAFDKLKAAGMVCCAVCNSTEVTKAIMAPRVAVKSNVKNDATPKADAPSDAPSANITKERPLSTPATPAEQAISELKAHIEKNSDYVGDNFATEARAMHEGSSPERSIHGQARPEEARKLIEDGIPVAPLPFRPTNKNN
jgi:hypothetical protein